jgi:cytochrome oxidase Cu insertion factor (SCO1/SenC/PrrC family)
MHNFDKTPANAQRRARRARAAGLMATPLIILLALGFGYWLGRQQAPRAPALPVLGKAPSFRDFRNQLGQPVASAQFIGKVQVVTFLDPYCTNDCPLVALHLVALENDLRLAQLHRRVQLVAFNVDPWHTGPAQAAAFMREYGWQPDDTRWQFLSGTPAATRRVVRQGYHIDYAQVSLAAEAAADARAKARGDYVPQPQVANALAVRANPDFDVIHNDMLELVGPNGHVRWLSGDADSVGDVHLLNLIRGLLQSR